MLDKLLKATKLLYPTGWAYRLFENNNIGKIHKALAQSEDRLIQGVFGIYHEILPDTFNFTAEMASEWERRLGMKVDPNVTLQQRKLLIKRKINHPGDIPGRQSIDYLNEQLQIAGFTNLYFHKNKFNGVAKAPEEIISTEHADSTEHGDAEHGASYGEVLIDHLEPEIDKDRYETYLANTPKSQNLEPFYRMTFFVADSNLGYADVNSARRRELRRLILQLMPANMIGFLIVNWT